MRVGKLAAAAAVVTCLAVWHTSWSDAPQGPCADSLTSHIPARPAGAPGGHAFGASLQGLDADERESRIKHELLTGNIPDFLRRLQPVRLHETAADGKPVDIVVCAAVDYLAVGTDEDFVLVPMRLSTALTAAAKYDLTLPTPRLVDAIYAQASVHLAPQPLPASDAMRSTAYFLRHNEMIEAQRRALGASAGEFSAGHKKDLVLTNRLWNHLDRVAIYGWHLTGGEPIQPLSTVHGWRYADYSHGVRLISTRIFIDGAPRSIFQIMQLPALCAALSAEGVMENLSALIGRLGARAPAAIASIVMAPN